MSIGDKIKQSLEMRGMMQKELAEKTGITEVTISRYIAGSRTPNAKSIKKLCEVLHISSDWLLEINK